MTDLLAAADVVRGRGRIGVEAASSCGMFSAVSDICTPSKLNALSGSASSGPGAYSTSPFATIVSLGVRSTFCSPEEAAALLNDAIMEAETEKAAGAVLWYGIGSSESWLGDSRVTNVDEGSSTKQTVAAVLSAFHRKNVGTRPILHLGIEAALDLSASGMIDDLGHLVTVKVPVVVNPSYPTTGVAVTGPVRIVLDETVIQDAYDVENNDMSYQAQRVGTLDFDPCTAVVAGDVPMGVYVTSIGSLQVRLSGVNNESSATVAWGDGDTNPLAPGGHVDHTYDDPGTFEITVTDGDRSRAVTVVVKE